MSKRNFLSFFKSFLISDKMPPLWLQVSIVIITLIFVAIVVFVGNQTRNEIEKLAIKQFNQQQLILARSSAKGIEAFYSDLSASLLSLSKLPSIQHISPECLQYIQNTFYSLPSRSSIRLLDSDGVLQFIFPFDGWRGKMVGKDYSQESYFKKTRKTGNLSISGLIINEQNETRVRIAVPIYLTYKTKRVRVGNKTGIIITPIDPNRSNLKKFQGVLLGSFDPKIISEVFISHIVSGKTGYAWLLSENGFFITHYEKAFIDKNVFKIRIEKNPEVSCKAIELIQREMMAGKEGMGSYISGWHLGKKGNVEKLIAYTPVHLDKHIWSIAVCTPLTEVKEISYITKRSEYFTLILVILILIIGGIFFFLVSYRWSHFLELEMIKKTIELRETSDYLNNLIKYANAPIIVWDSNKRITIFNKAFEKMSGWTEKEIIKQSLDILFPEDSYYTSLNEIKNTLEGENWETVEIPILHKNGNIRIGLWNSANIYSEDGKTLFATIAQGQDITYRKQTEKKYTEQLKNFIELGNQMRMELRLDILLQSICDMIVDSLGWRQVILSLRDYDSKTSRPVTMAGYDKNIIKEILSKPPVQIKEAEKFQQKKFKISRSYYIDHTHWNEMKGYPAGLIIKHMDDLDPDGWNEKDILLIPIQGKDNILGFISPDNPTDGKRPTKEIIQALEIFADQAAVSIENARLYGQAQQEISDRKLAEEALKHRLIALSQPFHDVEDVKLTDIIDIDILQKLQDGFAESYDVASLIFDDKGKPITKPSNFTDFCKIIRGTEKGMQNCKFSDAYLSKLTPNKPSKIATCKNFKEMLDGSVPIFIGKKQVATWGIGQRLISEISSETIRRYAEEIGIDAKQLISAGKKLKTGTKEQFKRALSFLESIANDISLLGLQNIQQAHEIIERRKAEKELSIEKEKLSVTLQAIGDGVITTDINGKIILFNKIAEKLTGWNEKEAIDNPLSEIFNVINERTRKPIEELVDKVLKSANRTGFVNYPILIAKDGTERIIANNSALIRDKENKIIGIVLAFHDITEQRRAEEELQKATKLESIGILAGGIAHDFNNILTGIIGNISLARMYAQPTSKIYKALENAEGASLRAKDLTYQLLTFSQGRIPIKKTASIAEIIKDSVRFTLRGSNVKCEFSFPNNLFPVEIDIGQINQVINNFIINADQAMPEGGLIGIGVENITVDNESSLPLDKGKYIMITIEDEGIGISEEHLQRVFDPYFTTKQKGSGLGLAVSYSIIRNHGGYITVESKLDIGTTFHIYLPASEKKVKGQKTEEGKPLVGKGRVLLMDDKEVIRNTVGEMLEVIGYEGTFVKDGIEAIEVYKQNKILGEPFDVVIMDLTIPGGMGGKETIKRLLLIDPTAKVIVSSGYSNDPIMANYEKFGFKGIITKPYNMEELSKILHNVITGESD